MFPNCMYTKRELQFKATKKLKPIAVRSSCSYYYYYISDSTDYLIDKNGN